MRIGKAALSAALRLALAAACVSGLAASAAAQNEEQIEVTTEIVNLNVAVTDRQGQRIGGLGKEDFEVFEDGARQEIVFFSPAARPLKLVLLFDTSISMIEALPAAKQEAIKLLNGLQLEDEVTVVSFAAEIKRHCGWAAKGEAEEAIRKLAPEDHSTPQPPALGRTGYNVGDGNTYLYEALRYVLKNFRDDDDRIAVIVFSDGVDTGAGRSIDKIRERADALGREVMRYAEESWALLYPIRYETKGFIGSLPEPAWRPAGAIKLGRPKFDDPGRKLFSEIATRSGGEVFEWATRRDLTNAVENALADLRSGYEVAYRPTRAAKNGEFRRVKVRLKRPGMIARTREGYRVMK